ncbi:eCIS core domain-containing protein [Longimicrobium sp.]|uniref:eCIS core domain-containing protein n=1 Tax=Longimicrobium sp. TaxID=2029185 RepID=UPI003B3BD195
MSTPRPPKTVTHARAKKPKAPVPVVAHRPPAPSTAGAASARPEAAWAGAPAAAFGIAGPVGIQLKPVIGAPDDAYEREADKVANQVTSGPAVAPPRITPVTPSALRRPVQRAPRDEDADQPVQRATAGDPTHRGEEEARSRSSIPAALVQRATAGDRTEHDDPPLEGVQGVEEKVQRASVGGAATRAGLRIGREDGGPEMQDAAARAIARRGPGAPMVPGVRALIEARLGVDLGHVRVHTDAEARRATGALGARAFTHGSDIWLARGESPADTRLLAHEATHVVQQGAAGPAIDAAAPSASPSAPASPTHAAATASAPPSPRRRARHRPQSAARRPTNPPRQGTPTSAATPATSNESAATSTAASTATHGATPAATHGAARASSTPAAATSAVSTAMATGAAGTVQRWIPQVIRDELNDYAEYIPGWTLFTVIIGFNPLTGRNVERSAHNLVHGFLELVPFGAALYDKLNEHGVIGAAVEWVTGELSRLDLSLDRLERTVEAAWDDVELLEGWDYNVAVLRRHFKPLYDDVVSFAGSIVDKVVELIKEAAIGVAEGFLAENRAWALLKKILGRDPLRDVQVSATPAEILADFLTLIGKEEHLRQMRERGTLEETANWLAQQFATFMGLLTDLTSLFARAWDAIQPSNIASLGENLRSLAAAAGAFIQRVWDFATTVAAKVLEFVKKSLLGWLASFANDVPGFHLATVIIRKNPFTDEPVPRTPANLIRGFITLLPNGAAIYARLQETGTIARVAGRIAGAMEALGISWEFVKGIFTGIWNDLSIEDLIHPVDAFNRIVERYGEPIARLFAFVNVVIREMVSIILEIMNFPSDLIGSIVANAMAAIEDVKRDPIGFFRNMLAAVKRGFGSFFDHILTHLAGGLADWLFRGLRQAGIEPPRDLSLRSVLDFVLQVLGISIDRIWQKLADRIGPERVARIRGAIDRLTGIWTFVKDVQERGVAAIWEHIESQISNLWEMVVQKARDWIMERVINRAIQWLMSLLDITGIMPVINGFMAFFRAIQSAIDYLRDILAIVNDYVATLAAVARGDVDPGAQKIEGGLARSIPVAIGFLANQFGLGNIGEKIQEIVGGIRETVDRALDWLVDRAVATVQSLLQSLGIGGARQPGQAAAQPAAGEVDGAAPDRHPPLRDSFRFLGEDHTVRSEEQPDGSVRLMMASEQFNVFPDVLRRIKTQQVDRLTRDNKLTEAADLGAALEAIITDAEAKGAPGGIIAQARQAYLRQRNAVQQNPNALRAFDAANGTMSDALETAWEPHFDRYVAELKRLDGLYDFSGGVRNLVTIGQQIADRDRNLLVRVTEVNVRDGSSFGVRAVPVHVSATSGGQFLNYAMYSPTGAAGWGPVAGKPMLLAFPYITAGSSAWRGNLRTFRVTHSNRNTGTPSNSSEAVPGVVSGGTHPDRGHLIARSLGGPGAWASGNIVAMTWNANRGQMKTKIEDPVRDALDADPIPTHPTNHVIMEITVQPQAWTTPDYPEEVAVTHQTIHPVPGPVVSDVVDNR